MQEVEDTLPTDDVAPELPAEVSRRSSAPRTPRCRPQPCHTAPDVRLSRDQRWAALAPAPPHSESPCCPRPAS